jgi:hypothetical protein
MPLCSRRRRRNMPRSWRARDTAGLPIPRSTDRSYLRLRAPRGLRRPSSSHLSTDLALPGRMVSLDRARRVVYRLLSRSSECIQGILPNKELTGRAVLDGRSRRSFERTRWILRRDPATKSRSSPIASSAYTLNWMRVNYADALVQQQIRSRQISHRGGSHFQVSLLPFPSRSHH